MTLVRAAGLYPAAMAWARISPWTVSRTEWEEVGQRVGEVWMQRVSTYVGIPHAQPSCLLRPYM